MPSFGEGLKREREKKKITLDQVSVSTKISVRMLRAIEEERFDQLPGGIFNKSFVRAYARHLGLDEEQVVDDYMAASTPANGAQREDLELRAMAEQKEKERQRQARLSKNFPWGWVATGLVLVALGFSIWGVRWGHEPEDKKVVAADGAAERQERSTTSPVNPPLSLPPQVKAETKGAPPHYSPAAALPKPSPPAPGRADGSFTVLLSAKDNSWLSITADGKTIFTGTLIAPGEHLVRANDSIVIRAGNLGGLEIDFNGKRLPSQGEEGEARTLTFHSDGLGPSPPTPVSPPQ